MTDETKRYCVKDLDKMAELAYAAGAARERRRIRRLIAPHLAAIRSTEEYLRRHGHIIAADEVVGPIAAIDAATRAPKKARTK